MEDTFFREIHAVRKDLWVFFLTVLFGCWLADSDHMVNAEKFAQEKFGKKLTFHECPWHTRQTAGLFSQAQAKECSFRNQISLDNSWTEKRVLKLTYMKQLHDTNRFVGTDTQHKHRTAPSGTKHKPTNNRPTTQDHRLSPSTTHSNRSRTALRKDLCWKRLKHAMILYMARILRARIRAIPPRQCWREKHTGTRLERARKTDTILMIGMTEELSRLQLYRSFQQALGTKSLKESSN